MKPHRIVLCLLVYTFGSSGLFAESSQEKRLLGPIGTPFGKINGPKSKNDKILIVGGGPAGIHMAYKLQELGFTHVKVFEQSGRIGGKSKTVYHRQTPQDIGTCYTQPDYTEIYKLFEEFDAGGLQEMPAPTLFADINGNQVPLSVEGYIGKTIAEVAGITDPANVTAYFSQVIADYISLHYSLFGVYEGELMLRPSQAVLDRLNCSFLDFLIRNNLEAMKGLAYPANTVQGYGFLNEIPALYGLMWLTPNFLRTYAVATPGNRPIKIASKGFQFLWEEMARQRSLDVRFYHDVIYICRKKRKGRPPILVKYQRMQCDVKEEYFDFVMTTPYVKEMIDNGQIKPNKKERSLFSRATPEYFTTTLLDTTYGNRTPSPQVYFDVDSDDPDNSVLAFRDSYASYQYLTGLNYTSGVYPGAPDNQTYQSSVFYQIAKRKQSSRRIRRKLIKTLSETMNMDLVNNVEQNTWTYFPRYQKDEITSGILWDIFDIQGESNVWFLGSSVCFESIKSVVEYNLLLLRNYDVPT